MIDIHFIQAITLVESVVVLMLAINIMIILPRYRWIFVPFIIWISYTILFYALVFIRDNGHPLPLDFTLLSAIRGLLAISLIGGILAGFRTGYISINGSRRLVQ